MGRHVRRGDVGAAFEGARKGRKGRQDIQTTRAAARRVRIQDATDQQVVDDLNEQLDEQQKDGK